MDQTQAKLRSDKQRRILSNPWIELGLGLALLLVLLSPLATPYFQPGFQVAHDRITPFLRVQALSDALAHGQIPPRWFPQFDGGYGSPYPSFYGMAFYYVAAFFNAVGIPLGSSVELTAFLTLALSSIGMFFLGRHLWGTPGGLLSAGLYVYAPYHLVDAFVRGAYSELAAFVWFPLILLFMLLWQDSGKLRWTAAGAFSVAGLVVTHNILSMVFLPTLPLLGIAILLGTGSIQSTRRILLGWSLMAVLGAILSAYFWLPAILDQGFIHSDYFLQYDYRGDFVGVRSLLATSFDHSLSTEIGIPLLLTAVTGSTVVLLSRTSARSRRVVLSAGALALLYAFMTNHRSLVFWEAVRPLAFVQFPWRLLAVLDFFLAIIAGSLAGNMRGQLAPWTLALALPAVAIIVHHTLIQIPDRVSREKVDTLSACEEVWGTQDYRPIWSQAAFWHSTNPPEASPETPVLPPCDSQIAQSHGSDLRILHASQTGTVWTVDYTAQRQAIVQLPVFYYPSWVASVDGSTVIVQPEKRTGLLELSVPAGTHQLRAALGRTGAQTAGFILSLLGGVGILGWWAAKWRQLRTSPSRSTETDDEEGYSASRSS